MGVSYEGRAKKAEKGTAGTTKPSTVMSKILGRAKKAGHHGESSSAGKIASRMRGKRSKMPEC